MVRVFVLPLGFLFITYLASPHILKFLQDSILLDLQVTNVAVKTALQGSLFSLQ